MSRRFWINLAVTLAVAACAGFIGAWAGAEGFRHRQEQTSLLTKAVQDMVEHGLDLTPTQHAAIDAVEARYTQRRNMLRVHIGQSNAELAQALSEEMAFGPKAQAAIDDLQSSVGDLQSSTVLYILEVRDVLTPQQRVLYDRKVVEALTAGAL